MKKTLVLAFAFCLAAAPALSRVAPHSGTTTCEGRIEQQGDHGWYVIDICSFDGNAAAGNAILKVCGVGDPCRVNAYGKWAPDFSIERLISAQRIDEKSLNEMPKEYQGVWILQHDDGAPTNGSEEGRMPVGTKGIGWLKRPCNVIGVETDQANTTVVKEFCGGAKVTELWSLHKLNGTEMLIVANAGASVASFKPDIRVYVRERQPAAGHP